MSTKCQSLQSCFQSHFAEPSAFGLKMAPTKLVQPMPWARMDMFLVSDSDSDTESNDENNNSNDFHKSSNSNKVHVICSKGGGEIDLLQSSGMEGKEEKENKVNYVHPVVKQFSSKLSEKSLELCTETLGCESGTNYYSDIDIYYSSGCKRVESETTTKKKNVSNLGGCGKVNRGSFPPPLPSINGSNCVNIMAYREGGRLVMKAVLVPTTTQSFCFQAQRRDGRLTLHLVGDDEKHKLEDSKPIQEDKETVSESVKQIEEDEPKYQEQELLSHEHQLQDEAEYMKEEIYEEEEINSANEKGMKKIQIVSSSRCVESGRKNKRLLIWEPCRLLKPFFWLSQLQYKKEITIFLCFMPLHLATD